VARLETNKESQSASLGLAFLMFRFNCIEDAYTRQNGSLNGKCRIRAADAARCQTGPLYRRQSLTTLKAQMGFGVDAAVNDGRSCDYRDLPLPGSLRAEERRTN